MITERYRQDYIGEFVVTHTVWKDGKKEQVREWVPNPVENHHISGRAVCIVDDVHKSQFDYTKLQRHRGGLLGSKKVQTYGVGKIAQQMRLDFVIDHDENILQQLIKNGYTKENIVYSRPKSCLRHPGELYFVPYNPLFDVASLLPYLAAFDGHKEIFMIGYIPESLTISDRWIDNIELIMKTYPGIRFYSVGSRHHTPLQWKEHSNFELIDYREFVTYCDI